MPFRIVRNDITKMNTEAVVNTANAMPEVGSGCDTAIYTAAGYDELIAYRKKNIGRVPEGEVFITPGFKLPSEYIIHAVSPLFVDGNHGEEDKLRACYRKSLLLAKDNGIKSISFPLIATGSFGYPKEEAMRIAVDEINAFLLSNQMDIVLVVFDTKSTELGEHLFPRLQAYIDHNYVLEKRDEEYGDRFFGSLRDDDEGFLEYDRGRAELENRLECNMSAPAAPAKACDARPRSPKAPSFLGAPLFASKSKESASLDADADIEQFESKLQERFDHMSDTFSQYLLYLISSKGMENAEVYKRAIVDKKTFSKIKNNPDYHPQKITALCLCVGARLNLDETKDLLARAGYALSPCDMTDIIFSFFIENEHFDIIDIDIQLEEQGLPCIIT